MATAISGRSAAVGNGPPSASGQDLPSCCFEAVLERHGPEVYRFLVHLTRNLADADDLYQEAALKAYSAFGRLDGSANHRAWFYRIASNTFLSDRRKRGRVGALDDATAASLSAPQVDHAARLDAGIALDRVRALIDGLPPKQRLALIARKKHDLSYPEIAQLLGCSEAAARANVHEAVRKMRDALGDLLA